MSNLTWTNERRKLGDLVPWPRNPRQIQADEARRLGESLTEFAQVETIAIGPDNEIFNGHQRLNVWIAEHGPGFEVDVRVSSRSLSERERQKLTVYLHKGAAGEWDWEALADWGIEKELLEWGFSEEELVGIYPEEPLPDPGPQLDRAAELQEKWNVQLGDLWEIGAHRLICGDCTDAEVVARVMEGEKVGVVVTDPPYGIDLQTDYTQINIRSKMVGNSVKRREYAPIVGDDVPFDASTVAGISGVKEQFWFGADYYASTLGDTEKGGSWLVWDKRKPSQDAGFGSGFELIWSKAKHKRVLLRYEWFGFLSGGNREAINRFHPTQKPSALFVEIIERWARPGPVYDPFLGSGTTMVSCEILGRVCRGIEIYPPYCAVTLERLSDMGLEAHRLG